MGNGGNKKPVVVLGQYDSGKVIEKVLPFIHDGGPKCTIDRTFTLTFSLSEAAR